MNASVALQTAHDPLEVSDNPRVAVGGNSPPMTPYEGHKANVDDLEAEAKNFLDGEPIANQEQAKAVAKLLDEARQARAAAEEQRKLEAKPFDEGKAAVQALWTPLTHEKTGRCALIAETCKKVLAPWLTKLEAEQRAVAEAARQEAEEKAAAARKILSAADTGNLHDRIEAEAALKAASRADRDATRAEKARPQAAGGGRATTLRTSYRGEITDPVLFGKWAWEHRRADYLAFLDVLAEREARTGPKSIPGLTVHEERKAV